VGYLVEPQKALRYLWILYTVEVYYLGFSFGGSLGYTMTRWKSGVNTDAGDDTYHI
jgi:hypothetical protein